MRTLRFEQALLRLKGETGRALDKEIAAMLGMSAAALNQRKRRDSFPVDRLHAVAQVEPELGIDVGFVLTGERHGAASDGVGDFTPPTFEEMAAFMDAEMVRMGMAQQADGTWRAAA